VRPLAPSRVDACNPLLQAHPTWARDKHEGRGIPPLTPVSLRLLPPSRSVSRRPIWAGARGDNLLVGPGTPGFETPTPSEVFFETIKAPSVELMERAVLTISPVHSEDWRTEIISFLQGNCLSDDEVYNKRMEARTRPYIIIEGELYKHGVCSPLLKCLSRTEGIELM
jgi:hypothetical protein